MGMKDLVSNVKTVVSIANATYAADNTPVVLDRAGYNSAMLELSIGAGGITFTTTNKVEFVLTHSSDGTTYTNVTDADMIGLTGITNGIIKSLVAAHAAGAVYKFGYKGGKRYLKVLADFSGTHATGTPIAANWLLGEPAIAPVA